MRDSNKTLLLLLMVPALLPSCRAVEERILDNLLDHYIAAQQALAEDELEQARESLEQLALASNGELRMLIEKAASGTDIETLRRGFQAVSEELVVKELPDGFVVARCPHGMEQGQAVWIQKDGKLANPYHGKHGVECGEIEAPP